MGTQKETTNDGTAQELCTNSLSDNTFELKSNSDFFRNSQFFLKDVLDGSHSEGF